MIALNPETIKTAYESLLADTPDARAQLILAVMPLADICTDQYLAKRSWVRASRDELADHGRAVVVQTVDILRKREKPVFSAQQYISRAVENAIAKHAIEQSM